MQDPMHDDDPSPTCDWCKQKPCQCDAKLSCGIENPENCEACE